MPRLPGLHIPGITLPPKKDSNKDPEPTPDDNSNQAADIPPDFSGLPGPLRGTAEAAYLLQKTVQNDRTVMTDLNKKIGLDGLFKKLAEIFLLIIVIFILIIIFLKVI